MMRRMGKRDRILKKFMTNYLSIGMVLRFFKLLIVSVVTRN